MFHKNLITAIVRNQKSVSLALLYGQYNKNMEKYGLQPMKLEYEEVEKLVKKCEDLLVVEQKEKFGTIEIVKLKNVKV